MGRLQHGLDDEPCTALESGGITRCQVEQRRQVVHVEVGERATVQETADLAGEALTASGRWIGTAGVRR